jgi:hypothetical protein
VLASDMLRSLGSMAKSIDVSGLEQKLPGHSAIKLPTKCLEVQCGQLQEREVDAPPMTLVACATSTVSHLPSTPRRIGFGIM